MKKSNLLKAIGKELKLSYEDQEQFSNFFNENNKLKDDEFYKNFKSTFPWVDYKFKYENLVRQRRIDNHLLFFKVITIISIVIGLISALLTLA